MKIDLRMVACVALLGAFVSVVNAGARPNHLEPIQAYDHTGDDYDQVVFKALIKDRRPSVWMLVMPSFRPEYAIVLRRAETKDSVNVIYELEYAVAERPIWNWKDIGEGKSVLDLRGDVNVQRIVAPFPTETALKVIESWKSVLEETRYPEEEFLDLDGVTYEFFARGRFGQTWSPESDVPRHMVDCGELLIEYVKSDSTGRDGVLGSINDLAAALVD